MYKIKNIVFAEAGNVIASPAYKGYQYEGNLEDFTELPVDINTGTIHDGLIWFDNLVMKYQKLDYAGWKTYIIKLRYSNDDQIAIMLNKDSGSPEDILRYTKMQEWRDWASQLATKLVELIYAH